MVRNSSDFFSTHHLNDESIIEKEKNLEKVMTDWSYNLLWWDGKPEVYYRMIYGGISGKVKIYSSESFAGKPAGESLDNFFIVLSEGMIKYPEMTLVTDKRRPVGQQLDFYFLDYSFQDYFMDGQVLCGIDKDLTICPVDGLSISEFPPLTIEIPVTGLNSKGEETTVVFTAELPAVPAS